MVMPLMDTKTIILLSAVFANKNLSTFCLYGLTQVIRANIENTQHLFQDAFILSLYLLKGKIRALCGQNSPPLVCSS